MNTSTFYDDLSLPENASEGEVAVAHMRLVSSANRQLSEVARINRAAEVLRDPVQRAAYDTELKLRREKAKVEQELLDLQLAMVPGLRFDPRQLSWLGRVDRMHKEKVTGMFFIRGWHVVALFTVFLAAGAWAWICMASLPDASATLYAATGNPFSLLWPIGHLLLVVGVPASLGAMLVMIVVFWNDDGTSDFGAAAFLPGILVAAVLLLSWICGYLSLTGVSLTAAMAFFLLLRVLLIRWQITKRRAASPKEVAVREWGIAGAAIGSSQASFTAKNVRKGVLGEEMTAEALKALSIIPGTRIVHCLRFPGSANADVDHAVLNGDRIVFLDSKLWCPGEYRWIANSQLQRYDEGEPRSLEIHMSSALKAYRSIFNISTETYVIVHPSGEGQLTFPAEGATSPDGIVISDVQTAVDAIGNWLISGPKAGTVNREVLRTLLNYRK